MIKYSHQNCAGFFFPPDFNLTTFQLMWSVALFPSERVAQCILEYETISAVGIKFISLGKKKDICL